MTPWLGAALIATASVASATAAAVPAGVVTRMDSIRLDAPGRARPLLGRVTAPASGRGLPVVVFSHGDSFSKDDYQPLADYWAENGFVVVQPTHLDSREGGVPAGDPARAANWRTRAEDMRRVADVLPQIEKRVPGLAGRIDPRRLIAAGHSFGGFTAEALIGARPTDPVAGRYADLSDGRFLGAVLMAPPGSGGDLAPEWRARAAYLGVDWGAMTRPALVLVGREDRTTMTTRDWTWRADAYRLAPAGGTCLLVIAGVGHYLGGIQGQDRSGTDPVAPAALSVVQRSTLAFMRGLVGDARAWALARARLEAGAPPAEPLQCR